MEFIIGQTEDNVIRKHVESLLRGMCVASDLNIDVSHSSMLNDTTMRVVFTGSDVETLMEYVHQYHNDSDSMSFEQEMFELVMCAATHADGVCYQDDGTVVVIYDIEFCPDVDSYRDCTEEDVVAQFEDMIKEVGFMVNGHNDVVYSLDAAKHLDEIAVTEWFNNWVDGRISDGDLPEAAANYSC